MGVQGKPLEMAIIGKLAIYIGVFGVMLQNSPKKSKEE